MAILERAGLALIAVDRHQSGCIEAADDAPLAPSRKAGAAEAAQRATLLKTRGLLIALVFVGAIIANVAGVIWLFAIIR